MKNDKLRVLVEQLNHAIALYSEADGSGTGPLVETLHALPPWKMRREDEILLKLVTPPDGVDPRVLPRFDVWVLWRPNIR